jgi:threonine synthase
MTLRDAVATAANTVSVAGRELAERSANASLPLQERLTAYSQLIQTEVGDTWLRRARGVERDFGVNGLYIKFEGANPTGTQKDRIAFAQVEEALMEGYGDIALATCGNYGVAVSLAARLAGISCRVFVPAGYHSKRIEEMHRLGAELYRPEGTYEDVVRHSSAEAGERGWYDANPGGKNAHLQIRAYSTIAEEVLEDLGRAPATVAVPVSNGTLLAGIFQGFERLRETGRIQTLPRMLAVSSTRKNPIVTSFISGSPRCLDLDPAKIRETVVNEPLINWHSFDGQEALDALYASGGAARSVTDRQLTKMSTYLREKEALQVLPAATAGLIALVEDGAAAPAVAILTAKR